MVRVVYIKRNLLSLLLLMYVDVVGVGVCRVSSLLISVGVCGRFGP